MKRQKPQHPNTPIIRMHTLQVPFLLEAFVVVDEDASVAVVQGLSPVRLMLDLFAAVHVFIVAVAAWFAAAAIARKVQGSQPRFHVRHVVVFS